MYYQNLFISREIKYVVVLQINAEMKKAGREILKGIGWILLIPVYFYKYAISPLTPASCRHIPTCSEYALQAIKVHGLFKGFWLATRRISKCHPWGTHGHDPVPPKKSKQIK